MRKTTLETDLEKVVLYVQPIRNQNNKIRVKLLPDIHPT
jgi:hypothetical protein